MLLIRLQVALIKYPWAHWRSAKVLPNKAAAVEELSATIFEISQNVKFTADNARIASNLSNEAGQRVMESNQYMQEMIAAKTEISKTSQKIKRSLTR